MKEPSPIGSASPRAGLVVDARAPGAWERLLGLARYERALLAAKQAGLRPLHLWLPADDEEARRTAEGFARDPRLAGEALTIHAGEAGLPPLVRVSGAAVFDAPAAAALVRGCDPRAAGLYLPPGAEGAASRLLRSLESPADGQVDTWLNRPLSRLLTRALAPTGVSPNAVTLLSFLIGLTGVGLIATRRYELGVAGALTLQLSAVIDCVDGELARLTYRASAFGARLDLVLDNLVHLLLFLALGWSSAPVLGLGLALGLGATAALGGLLSFLAVYRLKFLDPVTGRPRLQRLLDRLTNRDFSLLVIAACVAGRPELLLWLVAAGTHLFWLALLWAARRERSP